MQLLSQSRKHEWLRLLGKPILFSLAIIIMIYLLVVRCEINEQTVFSQSLQQTPEPAQCVICGTGESYHAPCLVNLSTGQVGELRVYRPDQEREGEIAEVQETGYFSFLRCAGLTGALEGGKYCSLVVPVSHTLMEAGHFCHECRSILSATAIEGYVLLELYDLDDIKAYPISDGASYAIRDYTVDIQQEQDGFEMVVTGLVHEKTGPL